MSLVNFQQAAAKCYIVVIDTDEPNISEEHLTHNCQALDQSSQISLRAYSEYRVPRFYSPEGRGFLKSVAKLSPPLETSTTFY